MPCSSRVSVATTMLKAKPCPRWLSLQPSFRSISSPSRGRGTGPSRRQRGGSTKISELDSVATIAMATAASTTLGHVEPVEPHPLARCRARYVAVFHDPHRALAEDGIEDPTFADVDRHCRGRCTSGRRDDQVKDSERAAVPSISFHSVDPVSVMRCGSRWSPRWAPPTAERSRSCPRQ